MTTHAFPLPTEDLTGAFEGVRAAPLHMTSDAFRAAGYELVDRIAEHLGTLDSRAVTSGETPDEIRAALQDALNSEKSLPENGTDAQTLLRQTTDLMLRHSLFNGHPRFFGYVTASPAPIGMLGDFLAAAVNANVGLWQLSPMATEIEAQTIRWIAELIGYPATCGGLLVSGGNMANLIALLAARASSATWNVRTAGVAADSARTLRVYATAETHAWVHKAVDVVGLGTDNIRWINTDSKLRMDPESLRAVLQRDRDMGELPMLVAATAGSVSTGAVDPLVEIASVCREFGVWLHVDGAYGGLAAAVPGENSDLGALALADSVAVDPHKWLYAPLEAGCVLVRDPARLRNAFTHHPNYYHLQEEAINYYDFGVQNSRGFRALKLWLALRQVGRAGYVQMIGDDIGLSKRLFALVSNHNELEGVTQSLSIATFRFVPRDLRAKIGERETEAYLNMLNETLLGQLQRSGDAFVSNAVVRGQYVLRACIVNFNTTQADLDALPDIVVRYGRQADKQLRSSLSQIDFG